MPGHRPAGPTPPDADSAVVRLCRRRHLRPADHGTDLPDPGPPPGSPERTLAENMEAMFLARGMTLTDPNTAQAATTSLEFAQLLVDGARAQGRIDGDQHRLLAGMLAAARRVPHIL